MTRDEAIDDVAGRNYKSASGNWDDEKAKAARMIDKWVDLGALKLDEPKRPEQRFLTELCKLGISINTDVIWLAVDRAGLKIVEK